MKINISDAKCSVTIIYGIPAEIVGVYNDKISFLLFTTQGRRMPNKSVSH